MAVDGFELAYDRAGSGPAVVLLHGWPGDRTDYRDLVPLLSGCEVVVPDLRGFGTPTSTSDPVEQYRGGQARSVADLITSLGIARALVVGYDIGGRIAQALARSRPDLVSAMVISPPLPEVGTRVSARAAARVLVPVVPPLPLSDQLIDGNPAAVRLSGHFWSTGLGRNSPSPTRTSTTWSPSTGRPGLSRPRCSGTGRARGPPRPPRTRPSPHPRTGSPPPLSSSGPSMTRCSPASGRTGSTRSSARRGSASWTASGTTRPWSTPVIAEEVYRFLAGERRKSPAYRACRTLEYTESSPPS